MPNRILREGILTSDRIREIAGEPAIECTYRRLCSVVDDFGRFSANPAILRAALYPLNLDLHTEADIQRHLQCCVQARLILLYTVAGKPYLEVLDFRQRTRAMRSKYPAPDGMTDSGQHQDGWHVAGEPKSLDCHMTVKCQSYAGRTDSDCPSPVSNPQPES